MKHVILTFVMLFVSAGGFGQSEKIDYESELRNGLVSFVNSLSEYHSTNMKFSEFKYKVIGASNERLIKPEAEALLLQSYELLQSKASDRDIFNSDPKKLGQTIYLAHQLNPKNIELGFIEVFGNPKYFASNFYDIQDLNQSECFAIDLNAKCKWYQIKCHLTSIFGEQAANTLINAFVQWLAGLLS